MIVKSFVVDNGKIKVVTLLSDKGIELFFTDTEIKESVNTLDVVSFDNNKLVLKVNGKTEITCKAPNAEKEEPEAVFVAEGVKEEIPAEEKVTFKKTVRPTAKTTKKVGK